MKNTNKHEPMFKLLYKKISRPFSIIDEENTVKIKDYIAKKRKSVEKAVKNRVRFKSFYEKYETE